MPRERRPQLFRALLLCLVTPVASAVQYADSLLAEKATRADAVVVATVVDAWSHWNTANSFLLTSYTLAMVDPVHAGGRGDTFTITELGGTLNEITHTASSSVALEVGERYLMLLNSGESISSFIGGPRGVFRLQSATATAPAVRRDQEHHGAPQALSDSAFQVLVDDLRAQLSGGRERQAETTPRASPAAATREAAGLLGKRMGPAVADSVPATDSRRSSVLRFNLLPNGFFSNDGAAYDRQMIERWNRWGADFQILPQATSTWAWQNRVSDIVGFVDDATLRTSFGRGWDDALAITFSLFENDVLVETDIALNPAHAWTGDELTGTGNNTVQFVQSALLHELGHAAGLAHPWEQQNVWFDSIMNYPPKRHNVAHIRASDTQALLALRPAAQTSEFDVLVTAFITADSAGGNGCATLFLSSCPEYLAGTPSATALNAGAAFSLTNFKLENLGRQALLNPRVAFYLVPTRFSAQNAVSLGEASFELQLGGSHSGATGTSVAHLQASGLRVPSTTPSGQYAVMLQFVDGQTGNGTQFSDAYADNDFAWTAEGFSVRISGTGNPAPNPVPNPTSGGNGGFINLSTNTEAASDGIAAGFIVQGQATRQFVLLGEGVAGMDAKLSLKTIDGLPLADNDSWQLAPENQQIGALIGRPPATASDAAIVVTLGPGAYVATLADSLGRANARGIVSINDVGGFQGATGSDDLISISTNSAVPTEGMTGGFIVKSPASRQFVIMGEDIAGIDPLITLETLDGRVLAENDNWQSAAENNQIQTLIGRPPAATQDAAVVVRLEPGIYLARLRDAAGRSGLRGIMSISDVAGFQRLITKR